MNSDLKYLDKVNYSQDLPLENTFSDSRQLNPNQSNTISKFQL